jgi:hypothetical protein
MCSGATFQLLWYSRTSPFEVPLFKRLRRSKVDNVRYSSSIDCHRNTPRTSHPYLVGLALHASQCFFDSAD